MPKSFTEKESEQIRKTLMIKGKELFSIAGLRKTTVDDLVRSAGIAKGSFYKFFPCKEILYLEILEEIETNIRSSMATANLEGKELTKEGIKAFLSDIITSIDENPILLKMFDEKALELIMRKIPQERIEKHRENDSKWFVGLFKSWQNEGYLPETDEDVFSAVLRSVFILFTQKEVIGNDLFLPTMDLLFDFIAAGIIDSREAK
ncbi:MAG: TetR/AcrR family transcriptional regulator [Spirochaetales bacterium]|nr:TetR/AcrR family transcriptional regulator [Spirochaetales bacterium]